MLQARGAMVLVCMPEKRWHIPTKHSWHTSASCALLQQIQKTSLVHRWLGHALLRRLYKTKTFPVRSWFQVGLYSILHGRRAMVFFHARQTIAHTYQTQLADDCELRFTTTATENVSRAYTDFSKRVQRRCVRPSQTYTLTRPAPH